MLKITHNGGFFSCCNVRLLEILNYFHQNLKLPETVDSSYQFQHYRYRGGDLSKDFFQDRNDIEIPYQKYISFSSDPRENQFSDYSKLNYTDLKPFIDKYYEPSQKNKEYYDYYMKKYEIDPENTCGILYRGTNKSIETIQPPYDEVIQKAKEIKSKNPQIKFLIQTDSSEFLNYAKQNLEDYIEIEEIPKMNHSDKLYLPYVVHDNQIKQVCSNGYFAIIRILAKCKYLISTSGNGELFMLLFRGHANRYYQYLNEKEYIYGHRNVNFIPNKTNHWIINE